MSAHRSVLVLLSVALSTVSGAALAETADEIRRRAEATAVPVIISGRILLENGQPLPGIHLGILPQSEGSGPFGAFPTIKPFDGVPAICFGSMGGGPVVTDGNGRYSMTVMFLPDMPSDPFNASKKCSDYRNSLTRGASRLRPSPFHASTQHYNFELDTRAFPSVPQVKGGIDPPTKTPGGFAPQMKK